MLRTRWFNIHFKGPTWFRKFRVFHWYYHKPNKYYKRGDDGFIYGIGPEITIQIVGVGFTIYYDTI